MPPIDVILECSMARWSPGIGDPTIVGWVTVTAYILVTLTGFLCWHRTRQAAWHPLVLREKWFWLLFLLMYLGLGINKQLDIQSGLTAAGRCIAQMEGWYENRRSFQVWFVISLGVSGVILAGIAFLYFRQVLDRIWISVTGIMVTFCFILIRSIGIHDFDAIIQYSVNGIRMIWLLELAGIVLAAFGAFSARRRIEKSVAFQAAMTNRI